MAGCPTPDKLSDLRANRLSAAEQEQLRRHITSCDRCQQLVREQRQATETAVQPRPFPFLSPPKNDHELGWLKDYRIDNVLGVGGMAIVFDAEDTTLHRQAAIKVLRPELCDTASRERFLREARAIAKLPQEHVVTIYEVGEIGKMPFLAMERLRGSSLEDRLQRDHWLPLAEAIQIARETTEGLVAVHEAGMVHRDIKPDNIWLEAGSTPGKFRRVKLIDFGIARLSMQNATLTLPGQVIGTPAYMAPEQALGRVVDARADLFSLGCVLYRMLTGKTPFEGQNDNTIATLDAVIRGEPSPIDEVASQLPTAVAELVKHLLAKTPEERPQSAREVWHRLRDIEGPDSASSAINLPAPVVPNTALQRKPRPLGLWLGVAAIVAAVFVGAAIALYKLTPDTPDNGDPFTGEPIKIGILHSQSGPVALNERPIIDATQLAIDEINASGGVLGRKLEVVLEDGESREEVFAKAATRMIENDGVAVIFGCWTSSSRKRVAQVCKTYDRLLFYPAGYEGLGDFSSVFYLGGTPNQTILPLINYAYTDLNKRKFFLLGSEYVYSRVAGTVIKQRLKQLGAEVVGEQYVPLDEDAVHFQAVVKQIKDSKADMLINALDGHDNLNFLLELRRADLKPPAVTTAWLSVSEAELDYLRPRQLVGDCSAGCYFESIKRKENKAFVERFRKRFGKARRVNDPMETAYFGVYLWKKAVEEAGTTDTDAVRAALKTSTIDTPEGPIRVDGQTQHVYRKARVAMIEHDKRFKIVWESPEPLKPDPYPPPYKRKEWKQYLDRLYKEWGNSWEKHRQPEGSRRD